MLSNDKQLLILYFRQDSQHRQPVQSDSVQRVASVTDGGRQSARHREPGDPSDSVPGDYSHPLHHHPLLPPPGVQVQRGDWDPIQL